MKVTFKANDKLTFEFEADDQRTLFEQLASIQEVFGDLSFTSADGKYTTDNVKFNVRVTGDDDKYYELLCMEPGKYMYAKKKFGCHKKGGGLFPKRDEGQTSNWVKYNKESGKEESV